MRLRAWALSHSAYLIGGFEVDRRLLNFAFVVTPSGELFEIPKVNLSKGERELGIRSASPQVHTFTNSPLGSFAVLTCLDLLDKRMTDAVRGSADVLVCPAYDHSSQAYQHANDLCYQSFCWIVYCNNRVFSTHTQCIFGPVHEAPGSVAHQHLIWSHSEPNKGIAWELEIGKLRKARAGGETASQGWKFIAPPPGLMISSPAGTKGAAIELIQPGNRAVPWGSLFTMAVFRLFFSERWKGAYGRLVLLSVLFERGPSRFTDLFHEGPLGNKTSFNRILSDLIESDLVRREGSLYSITDGGRVAYGMLTDLGERGFKLLLDRHRSDLGRGNSHDADDMNFRPSVASFKTGWEYLEALAKAEQGRGDRLESDIQDQVYQWTRLLLKAKSS
jgi:hypothetical protein